MRRSYRGGQPGAGVWPVPHRLIARLAREGDPLDGFSGETVDMFAGEDLGVRRPTLAQLREEVARLESELDEALTVVTRLAPEDGTEASRRAALAYDEVDARLRKAAAALFLGEMERANGLLTPDE